MRAKRGQAIVETSVVLLVMLAAFLFFFDFAYGVVVQLHLNNAAARVARADAVGFNSFQRLKAARVAMLPVSGRREVPEENRVVPGVEGELGLVRTLMQCENEVEVRGVLFYERWHHLNQSAKRNNGRTEATVNFQMPLSMPSRFASLFGARGFGGETRQLSGVWAIEDHASYYLED